MKRTRKLTDHDRRRCGVGERLEDRYRVWTPCCQPAYSRHRIITELNCDLRPPGAIFRHKVDVELQLARRDRALRILVRGQAITALPARNRRLTAPEIARPTRAESTALGGEPSESNLHH